MDFEKTIEKLHKRYDTTESKVDRALAWTVASSVTAVIAITVLVAVFVFGFRLG